MKNTTVKGNKAEKFDSLFGDEEGSDDMPF